MELPEIDFTTMKSGIRRFLGALMRCSKCIFGDFRAKLSRVLQNLVILQSEGVIPLSTPLSQGVGYEKEKGVGYEIVAP